MPPLTRFPFCSVCWVTVVSFLKTLIIEFDKDLNFDDYPCLRETKTITKSFLNSLTLFLSQFVDEPVIFSGPFFRFYKPWRNYTAQNCHAVWKITALIKRIECFGLTSFVPRALNICIKTNGTNLLENTLISSFVVILKVVRYVWNEAKPNIDQIEKKQIKISIKEPQDF